MPSATLTWRNSGLGTKTGTAIANFINDFVTLFGTKAADANFSWVVSASNSAATPYYIAFKRKDGSPGRILIVNWTSVPAGNNPSLLDTTPGTNPFIAFFPNGNTDTPANLTAASGAVFGDDSGCTKVACGFSIGNGYTTSVQPFYFDSTEALVFGTQNPAVVTTYGMIAGYAVVDGNDVVYPVAVAMGSAGVISNWGASSSSPVTWTATTHIAGSATAVARMSIGGVSKPYFFAWVPSGTWASQAIGPSDILTDTANNKVWFVPTSLLGQTKGEGIIYKMRQIAYGPGTTGPFTVYNTTGPIAQAIQFSGSTAGSTNGNPWMTNFKI